MAGSPPAASPPRGDGLQGGFSNTSPATSPRLSMRQPVRRNNEYQSFGDYIGPSPTRGRTVSMNSQHPYPHAPPLPHYPQAHFYSAPKVDLGVPQSRSQSRKSGNSTFSAFDTLAFAGEETLTPANNVLLVGSGCNLNVYRVDKKRLDVIGSLEKLRGFVVAAKILPCATSCEPSRPLVALIIHGFEAPGPTTRLDSRHRHEEEFDPSATTSEAPYSVDVAAPHPGYQYQTTVEVYSLKLRVHVATLFKSAVVFGDSDYAGNPVYIPPPIGNLNIDVQRRFIVVSSGTSGEVYVFTNVIDGLADRPGPFECLGKLWTSVQTRNARKHSTSSTSSDTDAPNDRPSGRYDRADVPILSLSHRWLAIVPPQPSSRSTIHGKVDVPTKKPPGLSSHTAPTQPQTTCELDTPDQESTFNRVARDMTQEVIKGARWMGDQGMQYWKNYWSKSPESSTQPVQPLPTSPPQQTFPPTHAHDERQSRSSSQPTQVSVIDLEKLYVNQAAKSSSALQPIATFALPYGCSFLSFAPSGLMLLTASSKGDVQHIWDLMRMVYGKTDTMATGGSNTVPTSPTVRQITRFTRMTVASIIDVVWTEPTGKRLAIVTDKGTVHIFDLPPSAFQWPPPRRIPRRSTAPRENSKLESKTDSVQPATALGTAMNLLSDRAQPLLASVRGRPPSLGNAFSGLNFTAGAGVKSGKVVATTLSKSMGAATGTMNTIRHMGENRLQLPESTQSVQRGRIRWMLINDQTFIAVTGGNVVRIYSVRQSSNNSAGKRRPSVLGGRHTEHGIYDPPTDTSRREPTNTSHQSPMAGYWRNFGNPSSHATKSPNRHAVQPLSYAEIETNAPYQPFHSDRRVDLCVYNEDQREDDLELDTHRKQPTTSSEPWLFGEDIPTTVVSVGASMSDDTADEDKSIMDASPQQMENLVTLEGNDEQGQQVVVTTRRKKGKKGESLPLEEDEFFEYDCEVVDFAEERV